MILLYNQEQSSHSELFLETRNGGENIHFLFVFGNLFGYGSISLVGWVKRANGSL